MKISTAHSNRPVSPGNTRKLITCLAWLTVLPLVSAGSEPLRLANSTSPKCKYSVRDVGFVNVHEFAWQLTLVKPPGLEASAFEKLDTQVRQALDRSNLSHLWVEPNSKDLAEKTDLLRSRPRDPQGVTGILSNTRNQHFLFLENHAEGQSPQSLLDSLEPLLNSSARQKILESCSESLCMVVLFESADSAQNKQANQLLTSAMAKLEKQMWLLEKPTEKPPASLVLTQEQQPSEKWLLNSVGLDQVSEPTFAIMFGQGRRLGDLIPLSKASEANLVGTASICGGDCECELDRHWLYGTQMVHRWSLELERKTESSLDFDPHAAYVQSEVATIVRKARDDTVESKRIDLGPGLIIHDLETIEENPKKAPPTDITSTGPSHAEEPKNTPSSEEKSQGPSPQKVASEVNLFLVGLILLLVVGGGVTFFWSMSRGS